MQGFSEETDLADCSYVSVCIHPPKNDLVPTAHICFPTSGKKSLLTFDERICPYLSPASWFKQKLMYFKH